MSHPSHATAAEKPGGTKPAADAIAWHVAEGLHHPVAAYYDDGSRHIYVSNLGITPGNSDGSGYLSRLTPNGAVVDARWVSGLAAPKGLRSYRGQLFVACRDHLAAIDVGTAAVSRILVPGAQSLSDVAVDTAGVVYACDMPAGRIYAYDGTVVSLFADGEHLEYPNALLAIGNQLFVAGWGARPVTDQATATPGRLYAINLKTKQQTPVTTHPVGNLGGLERDDRCNFLVADWIGGKIYQVSPRGEVTLLLAGVHGAADHGFVPDRRLLVLPRMAENAVTAYDLTKIKK